MSENKEMSENPSFAPGQLWKDLKGGKTYLRVKDRFLDVHDGETFEKDLDGSFEYIGTVQPYIGYGSRLRVGEKSRSLPKCPESLEAGQLWGVRGCPWIYIIHERIFLKGVRHRGVFALVPIIGPSAGQSFGIYDAMNGDSIFKDDNYVYLGTAKNSRDVEFIFDD